MVPLQVLGVGTSIFCHGSQMQASMRMLLICRVDGIALILQDFKILR
jgi:hypothetical protein